MTGQCAGTCTETNDPNNPACAAEESCNANVPEKPDDGVKNGKKTDVDCGGPNAPKCATGKSCKVDSDCLEGTCSYAKKCIDAPSCKPHLGGDTCGKGEVGQPGAQHESCCKSLEVKGFTDPARPGKKVYLDKYEITAGRVRAFLAAMSAKYNGMPNVRAFIAQNQPAMWDPAWNKFLPADIDGETVIVDRFLLGDPRGTWPGAPPPPEEDEPRKTGTDFQFNGSLFVYLHGNNCSTHVGGYGFPTFFYPASTLAKLGPAEDFPPRADGIDFAGKPVAPSDYLETKSMNCITNAMLQAFCHWDGGQLATDAVLDFVTGSPATLGSKPGCGTQVAEDPPKTPASMTGGRCADLDQINATYDAGANLPEPGSPLNAVHYNYPGYVGSPTHDKAWQVAAPGRGSIAANGNAVDAIRLAPGDEPWMDLAGNLSEAVLTTTASGKFTGKFGLKYRGIGYQSARSRLNFDEQWDEKGKARIERAEARAGFAGGRCMRFK